MIVRDFARYLVAGCIAVAIHLAVLVVMVERFAVNPTLATSAGFVMACIVNYLLQQAWVFRAEGRHRVFFVRYVVVTGCTLALNILLFWLIHQFWGLWYFAAQILVTGFIFLLNFAVNRLYTFGAGPEKQA